MLTLNGELVSTEVQVSNCNHVNAFVTRLPRPLSGKSHCLVELHGEFLEIRRRKRLQVCLGPSTGSLSLIWRWALRVRSCSGRRCSCWRSQSENLEQFVFR